MDIRIKEKYILDIDTIESFFSINVTYFPHPLNTTTRMF